MKIAIVLSSEDQLATAGARIRYDRLKAAFDAAGHSFTLMLIESIRFSNGFDADVYVFSKCHDVRSLLLADIMARSGAKVGIDVFDDYYSEGVDSRLANLSSWFRAIRPNIAFALCSTDYIKSRLQRESADLPCHVVKDPFDTVDPEYIAANVEHNVARALSTRNLDIAWFGIGDNPIFQVGLQDVHAFSGVLARARSHGFEPRLAILTNKRALTQSRLELLARLPVPYRIDEWSVDLERELIARSLLCFLPVSAQPFSVSKSLNRAVTALTGGSQVLSSGFPLYKELEPFVYRDPFALLFDLTQNRLALRRETLPQFTDTLIRVADADVQAAHLLDFLSQLPAHSTEVTPQRNPIAVVHGVTTSAAMHKFAHRFHQLSVATPLTRLSLNYDLQITADPESDYLSVLISERGRQALNENLKPDAKPHHRVGEAALYSLVLRNMPQRQYKTLLESTSNTSTVMSLALHGPSVRLLVEVVQELFNPSSIYLSELAISHWFYISNAQLKVSA